jgi:hypothetical protein
MFVNFLSKTNSIRLIFENSTALQRLYEFWLKKCVEVFKKA